MRSFLFGLAGRRIKLAAAVLLLLSSALLITTTWAPDAPHLSASLLTIYLLFWALFLLLSRTPPNEIGKRFAVMTLTVVALLGLVEAPAWMRLVDYRQVFSTPGFPFWWNRPGYVTDPELLWVPEPHHRLRGRFARGDIGEFLCLPPHPPEEFDLRYDRHGFRNETDLTAAGIAVIGDSFVEAPMVPTPVLMTSVLGVLQKSTVVNLGLSGYGPRQQLVALKRYALPLHPNTIVWVFYEGNDLEDVQAYDATVPNAAQFVHTHWERSFTRNALWGIIRALERRECTPRPELVQHYGAVLDADGARRQIYFMDAGLPLSSQQVEALQKTQGVLEAAYSLCREQGIRLVVVLAPIEYRVYEGLSNFVEASDAVKSWIVNNLPERLGRMVAEISRDIDYLDLTPIFKAKAEQGTPIFLPDDMHWAPEGHRIAAEALHHLLSSRSLHDDRQAYRPRSSFSTPRQLSGR
jgi:hypothetical protein